MRLALLLIPMVASVAGVPCATDPDCAGPNGGPDTTAFRCCGTHEQAENCPKPPPMNDTGKP